MRVLIAEDEVKLAERIRTALTNAGMTADIAPDGVEAQFLGETEPYDAAVLDLGLPKIDGLTVLEHWRKADRKMPVLILTARSRWHEKLEIGRASCRERVESSGGGASSETETARYES